MMGLMAVALGNQSRTLTPLPSKNVSGGSSQCMDSRYHVIVSNELASFLDFIFGSAIIDHHLLTDRHTAEKETGVLFPYPAYQI